MKQAQFLIQKLCKIKYERFPYKIALKPNVQNPYTTVSWGPLALAPKAKLWNIRVPSKTNYLQKKTFVNKKNYENKFSRSYLHVHKKKWDIMNWCIFDNEKDNGSIFTQQSWIALARIITEKMLNL